MPPGALDKNFGGDGLVDTPVGTGDSVAEDVLQQTDGKLVAVGRSNGGIVSKDEFALARYLSDGTLDMDFSEDGKVNTAVGSDNASAFAILEQADHKLVVVGQAKNSNPQATNDFAVVRYLSDGKLDTSFSQDGIVLTPPGSTDEDDVFEDGAYAVVEMPDRDLVVAGFSGTASDSDFALVRYHQDCSLDTSFSPNVEPGKIIVDFGNGNDVAFSLIRQKSDGKLVAAGFSSDGSKDDFAIARFNADGTVDNTFNANGRKRTSVGTGTDHGHALIQQQNGKLVVAGFSTTGGNEDIALVRYNLDGSLDTGFSGDGKVRTDIGSNSDRAYQVLETVDHKLLVAGYTQVGVSDFDFVLMRYNADGKLDTSFGASGIIKTSFGTRTDQAFAAVQQADQNIVLVGVTLFTDQVPNQQRFALARYIYGDEDSDGVPDGDDNCIAVANPDQINTDKNFTAPYQADDLGDACDSDDDGDGVPDADDAFPLLPGEVSDNDGDGIGDVADVDDDNDCSLDDSDPFPLQNGLLNRFSGEKKSDYLGYSVANAGDLDNDGIDDVIVGVPRFDIKSDSHMLANAGRVTVYSGVGKAGAAPSALFTFTGEAGGDEFGSAVAGSGDVNGDSIPDIVVGAPKADVIGGDGKKRKR